MNRSGSGVQFARVPWVSKETSLLATTTRASYARRSGGGSNRTFDGNGTFHGMRAVYGSERNIHNPSSRIKAMLVCRVVIGKPYEISHEDHTIRSPPAGYDCVFGKPGWQSDFVEDEYVVYNADAIRAAYLVLYETAPNA